MTRQSISPEQRYATLVQAFIGNPDVTPPDETPSGNQFGSSALRINKKIFAMLVRGQLVVKLPKRRVHALIGAGEGEPFDAGRGRPMKEWLAVAPAHEEKWLPLATEAMEFVASNR